VKHNIERAAARRSTPHQGRSTFGGLSTQKKNGPKYRGFTRFFHIPGVYRIFYLIPGVNRIFNLIPGCIGETQKETRSTFKQDEQTGPSQRLKTEKNSLLWLESAILSTEDPTVPVPVWAIISSPSTNSYTPHKRKQERKKQGALKKRISSWLYRTSGGTSCQHHHSTGPRSRVNFFVKTIGGMWSVWDRSWISLFCPTCRICLGPHTVLFSKPKKENKRKTGKWAPVAYHF